MSYGCKGLYKSTINLSVALLLLLASLTECLSAGSSADVPLGTKGVRLEIIATGLRGDVGSESQLAPTDIVPDGLGRLFVTTQGGVIRVLDPNDSLLPTPFMTQAVSNTTPVSGRYGMTGLTFHPNFSNLGALGYGKFYTITTEPGDPNAVVDFGSADDHQDVVKEWTMNNINDNVFAGTVREVFRVGQSSFIHNVGDLAFDQDNYLYITSGDDAKSSQGAQLLTNIFGKVLKIDPLDPNATSAARGEVSANGNYRIPTDNPFFSTVGATKEIYAHGLRSPFRMNFDSVTGELWLGDVGQGSREEVNLIEAGANYGWPHWEGEIERVPNPVAGAIQPVFQYDHDDGISVIAGFRYRGSDLVNSLEDFVFADFLGSGDRAGSRLFYGDPNDGQEFEFIIDPKGPLFNNLNDPVDLMPERIFSVGQDENGELLLLATGKRLTGGQDGYVIRVKHALLGDFDDDGLVDDEDLEDWVDGYGTTSAIPSDGDADGDELVTGIDFLLWQREVELPVALAADFEGDGDVDTEDLSKWELAYSLSDDGDADGDTDSDGIDFLKWQEEFTGSEDLVAAAQSVPEPSSLALTSLLALAGCWRPRKQF